MAGPAPTDWAVDPTAASAREVAPGVWRLRLPLPWADIDHVNAWAVDAVDGGIVLFDCGSAGHPTLLEALERALRLAGRDLADVRLLVGTHAHTDHIGLAAEVIARSGCAFWAHPETGTIYDGCRRPAEVAAIRARWARGEGVPEALVPAFCDVTEEQTAIAEPIVPDVALGSGAVVPTALGDWRAIDAMGHSPSQLAFVQPESGTAIVGDALCSAFAPWFDLGYSPDPYAEWRATIERIGGLSDLTVALPGHGRPIVAVPALLDVFRAGFDERLDAVRRVVRAAPGGAWDVGLRAFGPARDEMGAVKRTDETAGYLWHLVVAGELVRGRHGDRVTHRPA